MPSNAASSISGPIKRVGLRADRRSSPARTAASSRSTKPSATLSWTISRRSVVQRWPAVPAAENRIARAASSRSALRATIVALLPPSSSSTRPKRSATRGPTARPIAVEPVADTSAMRGSSTSASPTSRSPWTSCTSPSGASPKRAQRPPHQLPSPARRRAASSRSASRSRDCRRPAPAPHSTPTRRPGN